MQIYDPNKITVIEPRGKLIDIRLNEVWAYRDLIYLFVRRDFVSQYKQTILGPLWHVVQPLLTTIIFTVVFSKIAGLPTDGLPPFLFYMAGVVIWTYFANVFTQVSGTFVQNSQMFGKVYFPRLVVPISVFLSKLIAFAIQFLLFLILLIYFSFGSDQLAINSAIFLTPFLLLMMGLLALGGGIIITAMTTRYRDLIVLITFGVQLLMYLTPVIYPLASLSEGMQFWASLNPIAPIIEAFRYAYLGQGLLSSGMLLRSALVIAMILFFGLIFFNRVERTFMDTV